MVAMNTVRTGNDRRNLWLFAVGVGIYFFVNFQRSSVPSSIFNQFQMDFNATAAAVAQISAVFMWVYAVMQLMVGVLVDRFGGARVIATGGVLFVAGSFCFPLCSTLPQVYWCRALVGIGCSAIFLSLVKEIDRLFPAQFSAMMGLLFIIGYGGSVVGTLPLTWIVERTGSWRTPFAVAGVASVVMLVIFWVCLRKTPLPPCRKQKIDLRSIVRPLLRTHSRHEMLAGAPNFACYYVLITVAGKKFLEDYGKLTPGQAGSVIFCMAILCAVLSYVTGTWSKNCGNRRIPFFRFALIVGLAGELLAFFGVLLNWHCSVLYLLAFVLVGISSGFGPVTNALMRELNPPQETGTAVGTSNFNSYLFVAVFSTLAGLLMDWCGGSAVIRTETAVIYPRSSYLALFVMTAAAACWALWMGWKVPETYGRNLAGDDARS